MDDLKSLRSLAKAMGVHTEYTDGLNRHVTVGPETLVRVCAALGAAVSRMSDSADALRALKAHRKTELLPPVLVAWQGAVSLPSMYHDGPIDARLHLSDGVELALEQHEGVLRPRDTIPFGYHRLSVEAAGRFESCTVISSPVESWRRPGHHRSWGVGTQLAALRSNRSRSVGDLKDLESLCRWVQSLGGDLVTVLPLLPTFNTGYPEPSPYSPVSRLFWSELILDLGEKHRSTGRPGWLDVRAADAEVRAALANYPLPELADLDERLIHYARFRGAQQKLGRNWRDWPEAARGGHLTPDQVDVEEERFHLVAQVLLRRQLHEVRERLERDGVRLGLDLAVGVHPDGFDPWSRQELFGHGMSVGAPPDGGFPSGQDWGFSPVLPEQSRREGHRYLANSIGHQASLAGVLRVDHIMAWTRLYWIPHGFSLDQGTYVSYPADELFAVLALESHFNRAEVVGENLGTVPADIEQALPKHRIWGMYLAMFSASDPRGVQEPTANDMALVGTHDTPPFLGWIKGTDIEDRIKYGLLKPSGAPAVIEERGVAASRLAEHLGGSLEQPRDLLARILEWLGRSRSPLVVPWLEDLWLEDIGVNLPGTPSSVRPNWQRPMGPLLEDIFANQDVADLLRRLQHARHSR